MEGGGGGGNGGAGEGEGSGAGQDASGALGDKAPAEAEAVVEGKEVIATQRDGEDDEAFMVSSTSRAPSAYHPLHRLHEYRRTSLKSTRYYCADLGIFEVSICSP